jgi:hypothetical protein
MSREICHYVETTEMYSVFIAQLLCWIYKENSIRTFVAYEENKSLLSHSIGKVGSLDQALDVQSHRLI